ncbi:MAG: hypothetical protein IAE96_12515 [Chitinophagaceae bacterium]|nr:hypothetical protein [Chitinophagaceae bacterium]
MKWSGFFIPFLFLLLSCGKEPFIRSADARLSVSADTLKYDTVFVSAGSVYQRLVIKNENDRQLRISSIDLSGGTGSVFKMNVDGVAGSGFSDIVIRANDSLYVFVQVNVDPSASGLPFVLRDSISIRYNGNEKKVQLEAWGQNARFLRNHILSTDETWNNDLPYVILGSLQVPAGKTLTINKGSRIYMHADAPLVINGRLRVLGEKDTADRVYFQGDRLDEPYKNYPASWPGIYFLDEATDNLLQYAVIRNAYQAIGLQGPSGNSQPKLLLYESVIDNAWDAGIIALNSSITARNCLISNCGKNILLAEGGQYQFTHCTVVSYANRFVEHKEPVLSLSNAAGSGSAALDAVFRNCIFWGDNGLVNDEVQVERSGSAPFNVLFDYSLWKVQNNPTGVTINQVINNQPPLFDSVNTIQSVYNFRLKEGSPALNKGTVTSVSTDLDGRPRPAGLPDLGCFEKQ